MIPASVPCRKRVKDGEEKPFWISFSDLMTALMVLFLVSMTVALLSITEKISEAERQELRRDEEITLLMNKLKEAAGNYPGVTVDVARKVVDFGDRARFERNRHVLTADQAHALRSFAPEILRQARHPMGARWLKRVVVEGFADQRGTYIHNLNLSMQRSQRVMCVLLAPPSLVVSDALSVDDRLLVRELFLVGGSSFNALKASDDESRRVELKLEFLGVGEARPESRQVPLDDDGTFRCPLD
jgi:outer membrane protein OmpA-like peptidoglycan-associated protein